MSKSQHYFLPFDFDSAHKNKDKKKDLSTIISHLHVVYLHRSITNGHQKTKGNNFSQSSVE